MMGALCATAEDLLSTVVTVYGRPLMKFFQSRVADAAEAQDLVQEVYLRILKVGRPELIRCPRAYVYRTAANLAREHWLKRSSIPAHIALDEAPEETLPTDAKAFEATSPEDAVEIAEGLDELARLLGQLSPKVQQAVVWAHRDGHSYEEIGERLSVSKTMVKKYLMKGLAHCRKGAMAEAM